VVSAALRPEHHLCGAVCLHTGLLLFWQSLILVVLEGRGEDVAAYLLRARTVCVDVDATGRKVG
jgi:hypothetical protein